MLCAFDIVLQTLGIQGEQEEDAALGDEHHDNRAEGQGFFDLGEGEGLVADGFDVHECVNSYIASTVPVDHPIRSP